MNYRKHILKKGLLVLLILYPDLIFTTQLTTPWSVSVVKADTGNDCGKDCGDKGSSKPSDNSGSGNSDYGGTGSSGDNSGSNKPSDNSGSKNGGTGGSISSETKNKHKDKGSTSAESTCPKQDVGPNGICSHTESLPVTQKCPAGTSEVISNGKRFCVPPETIQHNTCPTGTIFTRSHGCRPVGTGNSSNVNSTLSKGGTFAFASRNGTLTINKIVSTARMLIPDASYLITPNPYTLRNSLLVHDNDKSDFNSTKGAVLLKGLAFSSYVIREVIPHKTHDYILHEARISINNQLQHPVLDIAEDNKLSKPLHDTRIPFQYLVMLKSNATNDPKSVADKFIAEGAQLIHVYRYSLSGFAIKITNPTILDELSNDPRIAAVEQDKVGRIASAAGIPIGSDEQTIPTGIMRVYENSLSNNSQIESSSNGQRPVNADIAVVDTGISKTHPDLNVYRDVTFIKGTTSGNDDNGHGSHVAGTVGAKDNSFGVIGVAPGARLWAVKVCDALGNCPISNQIAGLDYVTQHAKEIDVVNLSIENPLSHSLDVATTKAVSEGLIVIAAAGNSAVDAKSTSPAHDPDAISVSAIADSDGKCGGLGRVTIGGPDDTLANFSNFGPSVTMAAPGVDILSTYYKDHYGLESGTSMAAPHVAGAAALYKSYHPTATPSEIRWALLNSASRLTTLCDGSSHGYFTDDAHNSRQPLLYINK